MIGRFYISESIKERWGFLKVSSLLRSILRLIQPDGGTSSPSSLSMLILMLNLHDNFCDGKVDIFNSGTGCQSEGKAIRIIIGGD